MLDAIRRICRAESQASGAERPPAFTTINRYPLTENDPAATAAAGAWLGFDSLRA
jgi:hippurate hydrolase